MMAAELQNVRPGRPVSRIPLDATRRPQNVRLCGKPVSRADGQLTVQNGGSVRACVVMGPITQCDAAPPADRSERCSYGLSRVRLTFFGSHFLGSESKWNSGYLLGCGQDREGPLVVEGKLL